MRAVPPPSGAPDEDAPYKATTEQCPRTVDTPQRGPWQGFFARNIDKTNIVNAYNGNDVVLSMAWMLMQTQQKPNVGSKAKQLASAAAGVALDLARTVAAKGTVPLSWPPDFQLTQADDPRATAFWAQLNFTTSAETGVFPSGDTASNIIRQWGELSQWFPSLTDPVGNVPTNNVVGIPDIPFSNYSPNLPALVTTHTYLYDMPYSSVDGAYMVLRQYLRGN